MIDFLATLPHFVDHLAPVWRAMPEDRRGDFLVPGRLVRHATARGVEPTRISGRLPLGRNLTVTTAFADCERARGARRPVVLMEHGAGQTYIGVPDTGSYVGSKRRDGVALALVPGHKAAERQRAATPDLPVAAVGCPKIDDYLAIPPPSNTEPVIAFTHHWDCKLVPETRSGWAAARDQYPVLAERFPGAIMHAHPRSVANMKATLERTGMEVVVDFAEVVARADVLVCDNSSVMFEWAALDRPVVVLDLPSYRRNVHHGGRFWEWAHVGVRCDLDLGVPIAGSVLHALSDPPEVAASRERVARMVYAHIGDATPRAVEAILAADPQGEP